MNISKLLMKPFTLFLSLLFLGGCSFNNYETTVSTQIIVDQDDSYPGSNSELVSFEFPEVVEPGETYPLKIVFENTGKMPWLAFKKFGVGQGVGTLPFGGKAMNFLPPYSIVMPGQRYVFTKELLIPEWPGEYYEQFRMLRIAGAEWWFGKTLELRVKIVEK